MHYGQLENRELCQTRGAMGSWPNRLVRDKWKYLRKIEQHLPIKSGQPIGMALANCSCWKVRDHAQSFVLRSYTMHELNQHIAIG